MTDVFKALSDENRLRVLHLIMNGYWCGCEIEVLLEMTQSNVSRHLAKLKSAGVIKGDKSAQWVHYTINETFSNKHHDLYNYLSSQFKENEVFKNDLKRVEHYTASGMSCTWIAEDKNHVLELLKK